MSFSRENTTPTAKKKMKLVEFKIFRNKNYVSLLYFVKFVVQLCDQSGSDSKIK